jgi:hypothetical protein
MKTYLQFVGSRPGSVEELASRFFNVLVTQDVLYEMSQIRATDAESRRKIFCDRYPFRAWVLNNHNAILLSLAGFLGVANFMLSCFIDKPETSALLGWTVLCSFFMCGVPSIFVVLLCLPHFNIRHWEKTQVSKLSSFDKTEFDTLTQQGKFKVYKHTHPGSSQGFLSVVGEGSLGYQVEYFVV